MKKLWFFVSVLLLCSCVSNDNKRLAEIYKKKGFDEPMKRLKPEIIKNREEITDLATLNIKDTFGTINTYGEFCLARMDAAGNIKLEPVVPGFPRALGKFYSDSEHNVMWLVAGRGFYAVDIESKKTGHIVVSHDGDDGILTTFLADNEKKIFFIEVVHYDFDDSPAYFLLYDLLKDEIIFKSPTYQGVYLPFAPNQFLFNEFIKTNEEYSLKWQMRDFHAKKLPDNDLVKALTRFQIDIWPKPKSIHLGKRMAIGTARLPGGLMYYSIRWDSELEKVKVEPLLIHKPENMLLDTAFLFSTDGNWVKTSGEKLLESGLFSNVPELMIYHVSTIYPQGLSLPIYCGYTEEKMPGAFIEHSTWGPCYLEANLEQPNKLFVYKLNDGLKLLAEEAAGSAGS